VPVADQSEALACPCLINFVPWQSVCLRDGVPAEGLKWVYIHGLGSEQTMRCFCDMYAQVPNNKTVGMLFPNNADAQAWMDPTAAPKILGELGFRLVVPDYYQSGAEDFSQQISMFKKEGCDILCGSNPPPDFTNFWKQSLQQGFHPKLASTGIALFFPETLAAIGDIGYGLIGEVTWHPSWPYKDSLTGQTAKELADDYEARTGHQWTPVIGTYAKFEWAVDVLRRAKNPEDKEDIVRAIRTTNMTTTIGPLDLTSPVDLNSNHPTPNAFKPSYSGGQWRKGAKWPFEIVVCSVAEAPGAVAQAVTEPLNYQ
jgi:branched-chain amino acid transport system substrate-binding protein